MSLNKRVEYYFRTAFGIGGMTEVLGDFLKNRDALLTEKEKVIGAVSAFWLPFALMHKGGYSEDYLKQCAREAIYKLTLHINYLAESFGLEVGEQVIPGHTRKTQGRKSTLNSSSKEQLSISVASKPDLVNQEATEAIVEYTPQDFIHNQDDDTFQEMFS
ncbi:hypothetical protein WKK05_40620 (plasmid) [Nostoc sp. UHCC 0302]|uniref:hypothetical protein n=1 Tax=Nostoc sp. UHCC 0302 TaxID=3134896 RepID=UPI00311CCDE6